MLITRRNVSLSTIAFILGAGAPAAFASPIQTIDARYGLTNKVLEEYRDAVVGRGPHVNTTIRLLVSTRHGFNFGELYLPRARRFQKLRIWVYIFHGRNVREPIRLNMVALSKKTVIRYLNQQVSFR